MLILRCFQQINSKNYLIGEIYRPPRTNFLKSIERFDFLLNECQKITNNIIIATDQNINLFNIDKKPFIQDHLTIL